MVKKEEILKKAAEHDRAAIKRCEVLIDETLSKEYGTERKVCVDCTGWSLPVRDALSAAYRDAGWTVEYVSNQRDGQSLIFS